MKSYLIKLSGVTPLMMHRDNLEFKAGVTKWQRDPANRDLSVPGDDRSPAWGWIGSLYHDGTTIALPTDSIMASVMGAGSQMKAARGKKSLKAQTQSGMAFAEPFLAFSVNGGKPTPMQKITVLKDEQDFDTHLEVVKRLGFTLDIRRVPVGNTKHVRVRPIFDHWTAQGQLNVWDDILTKDTLETLFYMAGDKYGLLEWRPNSKHPGPFGRFRSEVAVADK